MDNIEKWLKSLRLHKYTHLFKAMSYDEMLALEEKYLIDKEVTKGARNKMLISIKKLNLRRERLINMIDDLNQDNISMKEALTVLKDMLVTPIPPPQQPSTTTTFTATNTTNMVNNTSTTNNRHLSPYDLTHLFIETLEKVAHRLIGSAGMEDNACDGIMAAIVDECLKHNSFTKEQKLRVASFRQHFSREQKAKAANNFRTRPLNYHHFQHKSAQPAPPPPPPLLPLHHHNHQHQHQHSLLPPPPSPLHQRQPLRQAYKEYSLLEPRTTFELPCLRALAAAEKLNRRQLCFLSVFQN